MKHTCYEISQAQMEGSCEFILCSNISSLSKKRLSGRCALQCDWEHTNKTDAAGDKYCLFPSHIGAAGQQISCDDASEQRNYCSG